jgi:thiamine biosynthesis protein ThiS
MTIIVNGENMTVDSSTSVFALLEKLGQKLKCVVVELNQEILEKSTYADTSLVDGDTLEIIQFVPGG